MSVGMSSEPQGQVSMENSTSSLRNFPFNEAIGGSVNQGNELSTNNQVDQDDNSESPVNEFLQSESLLKTYVTPLLKFDSEDKNERANVQEIENRSIGK